MSNTKAPEKAVWKRDDTSAAVKNMILRPHMRLSTYETNGGLYGVHVLEKSYPNRFEKREWAEQFAVREMRKILTEVLDRLPEEEPAAND